MSYSAQIANFNVTCIASELSNGDSYDLSSCVNNILIQKKYLTDVFPLYIINMTLSADMVTIMRNNDMSVALTIGVYYQDTDSTTLYEIDTSYESERILTDVILTEMHKPLVFPGSTLYTDDESYVDNNTIPSIPYRFIGISNTTLAVNNPIINNVFLKTNIATICANILSSTKSNIPFYVDVVNNLSEYTSIIIPPNNPTMSIRYLQENYGIYLSPLIIFFDEDKNYMLSLVKSNRAGVNSLTLTVLDSDNTSNDSLTVAPFVDYDTNDIKIYTKNAPTLKSDELIQDHLDGIMSVNVSYDEIYGITKRYDSNQDLSNEKVSYYWNDSGSTTIEDYDVPDIMTTISVSGLDYTLIKPTTSVEFDTSHSGLTGTYCICECMAVLSAGDGTSSSFSNNVVLTLAKIKKKRNEEGFPFFISLFFP